MNGFLKKNNAYSVIKYATVQSRLNELCATIEEKERQLRGVRNGLNEKDEQIGKLCDRIRALENSCERLQSVIESFGDEADQKEVKLREIIGERDGLVIRNASLSRQMEYERREWSIERERLSMELDDVTRELELQKMILNGESISEIVQRVSRPTTINSQREIEGKEEEQQ
ncbi:unnamed protein product [Gongylonema pulchrum]|uniref:IF rod domain-containing protein n=1 Tax=Gongylonema pulchrum TaxID=637853 RepID=A0A183DD06_9BILA|nr:unnamed protein product [Gongylonema pulchrum]